MKEQVITFDLAMLANKKGFKEIPNYCYDINDKKSLLYDIEIYEYGELWGDDELYAPTQSLLQKWLRELYDINICIQYDKFSNKYKTNILKKIIIGCNTYDAYSTYNTYEEALEESLIEALKLI